MKYPLTPENIEAVLDIGDIQYMADGIGKENTCKLINVLGDKMFIPKPIDYSAPYAAGMKPEAKHTASFKEISGLIGSEAAKQLAAMDFLKDRYLLILIGAPSKFEEALEKWHEDTEFLSGIQTDAKLSQLGYV